MVTIYVRGERIGPISDTATLTRLLEAGEPVELKNDAVRTIGQFRPNVQTIPATPLVPWDPTITREDLDRMSAEGAFHSRKSKPDWGGSDGLRRVAPVRDPDADADRRRSGRNRSPDLALSL